jgi:hypothetical protein
VPVEIQDFYGKEKAYEIVAQSIEDYKKDILPTLKK